MAKLHICKKCTMNAHKVHQYRWLNYTFVRSVLRRFTRYASIYGVGYEYKNLLFIFHFPLHRLDSTSVCLGRKISNAFTVSVDKLFDTLINWPRYMNDWNIFCTLCARESFSQAPSALLVPLSIGSKFWPVWSYTFLCALEVTIEIRVNWTIKPWPSPSLSKFRLRKTIENWMVGKALVGGGRLSGSCQ